MCCHNFELEVLKTWKSEAMNFKLKWPSAAHAQAALCVAAAAWCASHIVLVWLVAGVLSGSPVTTAMPGAGHRECHWQSEQGPVNAAKSLKCLRSEWNVVSCYAAMQWCFLWSKCSFSQE